MQEDIIRFTLEDMEIHVGSQARQHDAGVLRACPQYIDEGLVQHLTFVCERIQNGSLALKALSLLSRTISRLPVPPTAERATTATGVRVPTTQTYLGAIHACCGDVPHIPVLPCSNCCIVQMHRSILLPHSLHTYWPIVVPHIL